MSVTCRYCDKVFSKQSSLNRHIREVHNKSIAYAKGTSSFKCLEENCNNLSFSRGLFLINHLEIEHGLKFKQETIHFKQMEEFKVWKQSVEQEFGSYYVVSRHNKDTGITYYNCNRSKTGHAQRRNDCQQGKGKSKGSIHIDSSCTSRIKMLKENGKITVHFQKRHYGHDMDISKIRLPKEECQKIATYLMSGVSPKRIIQTVHDNIGANLKRIDLLTMADIKNIKTSLVKGKNTNCPKEMFKRQCEAEAQMLENYKVEHQEEINIENNKLGQHIEISDTELGHSSLNERMESITEIIKKKINHIFCKLRNIDYNTIDISYLDNINYHLDEINNLINIPNKYKDESTCICKENSNKRYIGQQSYFDTTKKKKYLRISTSKLSKLEPAETTKLLPNQSDLIISTHPAEDHSYC